MHKISSANALVTVYRKSIKSFYPQIWILHIAVYPGVLYFDITISKALKNNILYSSFNQSKI